MNNEFWDGFDSGYDYGFMDGAAFAIKRLSMIHNKKLMIAIIVSSLTGIALTLSVKKLLKPTYNGNI